MYFVEIKGEKAFLTSEEVNGGSACNRKVSLRTTEEQKLFCINWHCLCESLIWRIYQLHITFLYMQFENVRVQIVQSKRFVFISYKAEACSS